MRKKIVVLFLTLVFLSGCAEPSATDYTGPEYQEITVDEICFKNKFYYGQLSEEEKLIYKEIYQGVEAHDEEIIVHGSDGERAGKILQCMIYDFPEIFWIDGSSRTLVYEGSHTIVKPSYAHSKEERETMQEEIDRETDAILAPILSERGDYDKIKFIYETLINDVSYVEDSADNQNIYSALVRKESVCAGYAKANQYLLEKLGIYCIYVVGIADGESHAWNIVECDGTLYCVDVTWGDPYFTEKGQNEEILYDFLCCSKETLSYTHTEDTNYNYPNCDANDLEYYRLQGTFYENANRQTLLNTMYASINEKESSTVFKFSNPVVYEEARDLLKNELLETAAQHLCKQYHLQQVDCIYKDMTDLNRIVIYWNYE